MIHVYKMNDTDWLGPYGEVNVMFGVRLGDVVGSYSPYLFLSSDVGVTHGREIHGQPKKLAEPALEFRGDLIVGTCQRNGIDILTGTMPYKQQRADIAELDHFPFKTNINLKAVDHIDGTPGDPAADQPRAGGCRGHRMLARPLHGRVAPQRAGPGPPPAGARNAGRFLLARPVHAGAGRRDPRLSEGGCLMASHAWVLGVRPGYEDEYKKRHDELWPEMDATLRASGIRNYHIFRHGLTLFGYFETDDLPATIAYLKADPVNARWSAAYGRYHGHRHRRPHGLSLPFAETVEP